MSLNLEKSLCKKMLEIILELYVPEIAAMYFSLFWALYSLGLTSSLQRKAAYKNR